MLQMQNVGFFHNRESYIRLLDDQSYSRWWMSHFLPQELIKAMFKFGEDLQDCQLTETELLILCAIQLSDPGKDRDYCNVQVWRRSPGLSAYTPVPHSFGSSFTHRKQGLCLLVTYGRLLCHSSDESDLCLSTIRSVSNLHLVLSSGHFRLIRSRPTRQTLT